MSFLRWAGSKKKLLKRLLPYWQTSGCVRYVEPFAGSAMLFFAAHPQQALLADTNEDLIEMYADVLNLLQSMKIVEENEHRFLKSMSRYDDLKCKRQVVVTDDWYPCIDGNKIDLHLMLLCYPSSHKDYGNYCAKLTAWGGDDTGIEIERICWDLPSALKEYNQLLEIYNDIPDGVSRRWLCEKYGFKPA